MSTIWLMFVSFCLIECSNNSNPNLLKIENDSFDTINLDTVINNKFDYTFVMPDSVTYDRKKVYESMLNEIRDSLKNNAISELLYDECLDMNNLTYCSISSHRKVSLRKDLIDSLSLHELGIVLKYYDIKILKKTCQDTVPGIPFVQVSNWDFINHKQKG